MIKSELVQRIAEHNPHLYQRDVENIVNAILDEIVAALARGDRVELRGFGAFSVKHRPARAGRNPRTGEHVPVDQKSVPFFKTGKEMRERLNRDDAAPEAGALGVSGVLAVSARPSAEDTCRPPSTREMVMRKFFSALVLVPLGLIFVVFAVANRHMVTVSFDPFNATDPAVAVTHAAVRRHHRGGDHRRGGGRLGDLVPAAPLAACRAPARGRGPGGAVATGRSACQRSGLGAAICAAFPR